MDSREWTLTKHLKAHDSELFCKKVALDGPYCVYRKATQWESFEMEGSVVHVSRPSMNLCFALTDTWNFKGKPVDWGIEPVIQRAKETHFSRGDQVMKELINSYEENSKSKDRALKSKTEDFLKDFRGSFAKTFDDVNTSTLEKNDSRRKQDGNYK